MSDYYLWIDLLMNYHYFNKHLGNIITTLEQYNVHNNWYCFLFDTLNLDTDEDLYQQKKYYTKDVLAVLRNNFVPSSYADQQFMALVLAKDVIYDFFKAIPNAFDNIQLRPCYTLVFPKFFLGIYFNKYIGTVTETICGYELREAVRTIEIHPYNPNPEPSPYDPDPDNPNHPYGPYIPPQPITPPTPGPPYVPGKSPSLPDNLELYLWHEGNTPTDFTKFQGWANKILSFIKILNKTYKFEGTIYVMFKLGPVYPGNSNNCQKWDLSSCKPSKYDSNRNYPWFVTELFDHLGDPANNTGNARAMVLGDVGTKYDWIIDESKSISKPGTSGDNLDNFFSYVSQHINTKERLKNSLACKDSPERANCVYDIAFDHEGLGSYQNDTIYGGETNGDLGGGVGWIKSLWNKYMPTDVKVHVDNDGKIKNENKSTYRFGWANYQPAPTHKNSQGNNMAYAELYWIGELKPEGCIHYDITYNSCTDTIYRKNIDTTINTFLNDDFVDWKGNNSSFNKHLTSNYFKKNNTIGGITNIPENNIPLLSIEYLSGGKFGECLNNSEYGKTPGETDGSVCGTFDGFGCWPLQKYMELLERLTQPPYNFRRLGLYELSFLPTTNPDWFTI